MRTSETTVRSRRRGRGLSADQSVAARAVKRPAIADRTSSTVVPTCLVAGIAAALLSADLAWSHRVAVALTVAFGLAIALWHARPDRTNRWLTGALAVAMAVVGSRIDVLRGADPAWILWAAALAVAGSSARPVDASTDGGDDLNLMTTTVAVLAVSTAVFSAWWYVGGSALLVVTTIGAVPVAAVLFVGARASIARSGSMTPVAVTSGVIGTALALLDPVPHIGQAAIAAMITGVVGVTMSTVGSPSSNRFAKVLVLASLVTAAGASTWTVVVALGVGAFVVLRIGTPTGTVAAHRRSLPARSADPGDQTVATEDSAARGMPTGAPAVIESRAGAEESAEGADPDRVGPDDRPERRRFEWPRPDFVEVSDADHVADVPSNSSIVVPESVGQAPVLDPVAVADLADHLEVVLGATSGDDVVEIPAMETATEETSVDGPADQPDETPVEDDTDGRDDPGSEPQADHADGVSGGEGGTKVEWPLDRVLARFLSPIDESTRLEDAPTGRIETPTDTPLRSRLHAALHQDWSSCADPAGPHDGSIERNSRETETETETAGFAFDLWSALGLDQVDGANEPDRAAQSVFSQRSKTSVFDEPEATPRSNS